MSIYEQGCASVANELFGNGFGSGCSPYGSDNPYHGNQFFSGAQLQLTNEQLAQASASFWRQARYNEMSGYLDVNASTETAYPIVNNNSLNKKLEAAKKWLKERK